MHDLTGTVVAIVDDPEEGPEGVAALAYEQNPAGLLHGEKGRAHLTAHDEEGLSAIAKEVAGGQDVWRLGEWSFNRIGPEGSGEG